MSLFLLLDECFTKYLLRVDERKHNGRIPTCTDVNSLVSGLASKISVMGRIWAVARQAR